MFAIAHCNIWWILVIFIVLVVLWVAFSGYSRKTKSEGFDILGALAPYKQALYRCERDCEREDPSKRLLASGNIGCDYYCQSIFSKFAQNGPEASPPPPVVTEYDSCESQCAAGPFAHNSIARDKCISMCHCHEEVKKWCRELQCPYTDLDSDVCMKECIANQMTNCNQVSWTWKKHG